MTALTATQQFPYPTGPDRPCDSWQTWKALAQRLDTTFTSLSGDLDRTARAVPIAKVSMTGPFPIGINSANGQGNIIFDTVHGDTDGMVDLNKAPKVIVPTRAGIYHAIAHVRWTKGDLNNVMQVYINSGTSGTIEHGEVAYQGAAGALDDGAILQGLVGAGGSTASIPDAFGLTATYSGGSLADDITVLYAELALYWISDL